jgi:hypothetical protein
MGYSAKSTFFHAGQREKKSFFLGGEKVKISRIWIRNTCFAVDGSLFNLLRTLYGQGQPSYRVLNCEVLRNPKISRLRLSRQKLVSTTS